MALERIQKILARAGIASRRKAEELILSGRVKVDGSVVSELGTRADPKRSRIEVDGRRIAAQPLVYGVLHKPRGTVSTLRDPEGRPTVAELLRGVGVRVMPVGRLDFHTSGVLLFTNDGEFASALQHPRRAAPKVYVAKLKGMAPRDNLDRFRESIEIEGQPTRPAEVRFLRYEGDKTWIEVTLREGKNRQVRRLGEHAGYPVMRLARLSHAGVTAEGLRPGDWRLLSADELAKLKRDYGVPRRVRSQAASAPGATSSASLKRGRPRRAGSVARSGGAPSGGHRGASKPSASGGAGKRTASGGAGKRTASGGAGKRSASGGAGKRSGPRRGS